MLVQRVVKMMTKRWGAAVTDSMLSLRLFPPRSHLALYGVCWGGPDQPSGMTVGVTASSLSSQPHMTVCCINLQVVGEEV